jgi:mannose-6-phosphate isomerase-like protein (cupin superfamily)
VPDEQPGGRVGDAAPAKLREEHEASQVGDAAPAVRDVIPQDPGALPLAVLIDLDHEPARLLGLRERLLDLHGGAWRRKDRFAEERLTPSPWEAGPGATFAVHEHARAKLLVCRAGSIRFTLTRSGQDLDLSPGDWLDLPAGVNIEIKAT